MSKSKKHKGPLDLLNLSPEEQIKFEIAQELGLGDRILEQGWRCLTAKESGKIGGLISKRKRMMKLQVPEADTCQNQ